MGWVANAMTDDAQKAELDRDPAIWREGLDIQLGLTDDEAFLRMVWALNALQTGRADVGRPYFRNAPPEAAKDGIGGKHSVYPWELETLVNELLVTPKHAHGPLFDCRDWSAIATLVNELRGLENAEYGQRRAERSIIRELGRIGARQFEWQRGFFSIQQLYRSAYIYGQKACNDHLVATTGLTMPVLTLVGFALMSFYLGSSAIQPGSDLALLESLGASRDELEKAIALISQPLPDLRAEARQIRSDGELTAYKASVLRRFPCVLVGPGSSQMLAPLPELVSNRLTSGLFYDVIGGGGPVRDETGRQFESYSHALLNAMLPEFHFEREWAYQSRLGQMKSPDIMLALPDQTIGLAIECKALRMTVAARFGDEPQDERGYDEIVRGVFQLWRFFAHCRLGLTGRDVTDVARGVILTLDDWFAARHSILEQLLERAHARADQEKVPILPIDRRPIAFCSISEIEQTLRTATGASFLATIELAAGEKLGWIFPMVHQDVEAPKTEPKDFPFENEVCDLLPWYRRIGEMADDGTFAD